MHTLKNANNLLGKWCVECILELELNRKEACLDDTALALLWQLCVDSWVE